MPLLGGQGGKLGGPFLLPAATCCLGYAEQQAGHSSGQGDAGRMHCCGGEFEQRFC